MNKPLPLMPVAALPSDCSRDPEELKFKDVDAGPKVVLPDADGPKKPDWD